MICTTCGQWFDTTAHACQQQHVMTVPAVPDYMGPGWRPEVLPHGAVIWSKAPAVSREKLEALLREAYVNLAWMNGEPQSSATWQVSDWLQRAKAALDG